MRATISIVLILVALGCMWGAGSQHEPLTAMRARHVPASAHEMRNAPPIMVFTTVVLGGFGGLIADALWLRVAALQEENNYFELVQLADWITKLEPHCTEIWTFHAWNLSYNVSVMMPELEDRWRWVKNGIRLLRDEGVVYNPGDPELYMELGWIFLHKIGQTADPAHEYYKRQWAGEMLALLGSPHPDYDQLARQPAVISRMRNEYRLLPEVMKEIDGKYGPLDWTRPETHALYWAYRGKQMAGDKSTRTCEALIRSSLRMLSEKAAPAAPARGNDHNPSAEGAPGETH